jgi:hypothetical protein
MAEFYAITGSAPALTGLSATNLLAEPHPTHFHEFFEEVGITGDGKPIGAGFPWCEWEYENQILSAEAWHQLVSFFSGSQAYALVYIRTRTNEISGGTYLHKNFGAIMRRPEASSKSGYRFEAVSIKFTRLEQF